MNGHSLSSDKTVAKLAVIAKKRRAEGSVRNIGEPDVHDARSSDGQIRSHKCRIDRHR
jgi:hypothetical protein